MKRFFIICGLFLCSSMTTVVVSGNDDEGMEEMKGRLENPPQNKAPGNPTPEPFPIVVGDYVAFLPIFF